ncbi:MAG: IS1634 family transposase [Promethearchaeota archaeon]|nr:MAG: IS1634 family transposase [Candidatus Lokiarchaeota archaeon]
MFKYFFPPILIMVYLTRKKKGNKYYLYLEEKAWIDGRARRVFQKYLGPEDRLKDIKFNSLFTKYTSKVEFQTIEFGCSAALWQIAEEIDLAGIIDANTGKVRNQNLTLGEYITIAAISRCIAPCSKSKLTRWFEKDWLSTRYEVDPKILNAQTYWNHFQYLSKEVLAQIELALGRLVVEKYELDLDSLFYDPTNFFTFSKGGEGSNLLQFGHSKENQNGCRLVNYWLLCARESGIPLMHETYEGSIQDAKEFKQVPHRITDRLLALGRDPEQITLVFDKGNHSKEAFAAIDALGVGFIASRRNSTHKDLLSVPPEEFTETVLPMTNKVVEYYKATRKIYGKDRLLYVVLDPKKQKKHVISFGENLEKKVSDIKTFFKDRLNVKKWSKKEAVEKKLKSMIGKRPFADAIITELQGTDETMSLTVSIDETARKAHEETLGRTILFTNREDWAPEAVIWGYREQYIVEHAFRHMKSPTAIAVRPMYHHADTSVRAHVFLCVIALLLLSLLRLKLARKSVHVSYDELLGELKAIHVLKILPSPKAQTVWRLEKIPKTASKIVRALNLKHLLAS